jgi:uncharacterized damage-inducible protein DinB
MVLCCLMFAAGSAFAQADVAADVRKGFEEVNDWVVKSADMVPAEKYSYRPVDTVRTFGQLIAHIADSYDYFCSNAVGKEPSSDSAEKGKTDKETLIPKLKAAVGKCTAAYGDSNAKLRPLFGNVGHTNLHYGNIITYMRMMGLKPPSS